MRTWLSSQLWTALVPGLLFTGAVPFSPTV